MQARRWFAPTVSVGVGLIFLYSGILKMGDPLQFADNVASFEILPGAFVVPLALSLPIFEVLVGALLAIGFFRRLAALGAIIVTTVFLGAIVSALARGLTIDCGCFGSNLPSRERMWLDLARDIFLFAGAVISYRYAVPAERVLRTR
jgi:putative oxidoreductase